MIVPRRSVRLPAPWLLLAFAASLGSSCVGPQVSDRPGYIGLVLPPDAILSSIYDDPAVTAKVDAADGLASTVSLLSGFTGGKPTAYWDLGPAPDFAAPAFVLSLRDGDALVPLPHPPIFARLPGDVGYSPFRRVFTVEVTDLYAGELIPSVAALNEAQERGLVGAAKGSREGHDWPVTVPGVVATGGAVPGTAPVSSAATGEPRAFVFEGKTGLFLDFGATPINTGADAITVPALDVYVLHREGGEVLSEPARGVDMDGDGDALDSNNVFAAAPAEAAYSPRCRPIDVAVGAAVASIDTTHDQTKADIQAGAQLVSAAGTPVAPPVVALHPEEAMVNYPQRSP